MEGRGSEQGPGLRSLHIEKEPDEESRRNRTKNQEGTKNRIEKEPDGRKDGFRRVMAGLSGILIKFAG